MSCPLLAYYKMKLYLDKIDGIKRKNLNLYPFFILKHKLFK